MPPTEPLGLMAAESREFKLKPNEMLLMWQSSVFVGTDSFENPQTPFSRRKQHRKTEEILEAHRLKDGELGPGD